MAFDKDAGPPGERNEGLIALLRRRGLKSKQAGRQYRIQIEGIQESDCTHSWYWKRDIFVQLDRI